MAAGAAQSAAGQFSGAIWLSGWQLTDAAEIDSTDRASLGDGQTAAPHQFDRL